MIRSYEYFKKQIERFKENPTTSGAKGILLDIQTAFWLSAEEREALIKELKN